MTKYEQHIINNITDALKGGDKYGVWDAEFCLEQAELILNNHAGDMTRNTWKSFYSLISITKQKIGGKNND